MNKQFLKILSIFVLFFFSANLFFPQASFAELPCWNDGTIAYAEWGRGGATDVHQGDINRRGKTEVADPIDVSNGNYFYQNQDLFIPSRGSPLEINRFYNSLDTYEGPFGIGWSHSYNIFLLEVSDGSQTYILRRNANGSKDKFLKNPDGSYTASFGCYDTLVKEAEGYFIQDKHGLSYSFDLDGKLKSITDRNQNRISLEYDSETGVLTRVTDSLNRSIDFSYNNQHKVTQIRDFTDRTTSYEYNQEDNLVYVTTPSTEDYPSGLTTTYTYDGQHRLTSITDAKGQTYISLVYDENSRVKELTYGQGTYYFTYTSNLTALIDPKGFKTEYKLNPDGTVETKKQYTNYLRAEDPSYFQTRYEYNENRERTKIIYPKGNWIKYTYDDKGNVLEIRRKQINTEDIDDSLNDIVTTFTYEPNFNHIETIADPKGNITTYNYDVKGNLVKITYPAVGEVIAEAIFSYNAYGQVKIVTDPNGNITKYEYCPDTGYLKKIIMGFGSPDEAEIQLTYDTVGNVTSTTDPRGNTTSFAYNELNQIIQTISSAPFSYITDYFYDRNGNLERVSKETRDPSNPWQTTIYSYDILDQLKSITDELGNTTIFGYDANGNRILVQDAESNTTTYQHDERDLLWKVTDALGNTTEYAYDKNESLKEIKDARLNKTTYAYDDFDRLITTTYEDGTTETYTYAKNSNLYTKTDRKSQTITYDYDELNRLILKTYPDTSAIQYQYDAGSRLTDVTDSTGTIHYDYDAVNRVTQVTYPDTKTVGYEYDAVGNRTKLIYPDSTPITYEYDQLNRLTSIKDQTPSTIASYSYDALSKRANLILSNGTSTSYTYDAINRLTELANTYNPTPNTYSYTYDNIGNRKTMQTTEGTHSYTYDDIYQLTNVIYPDTTSTTYNYDKTGNRTSTVNGGTTTYVSDDMNQYDSVGGITYTYDDNGNITNDGTNTYTYDSENRLTSVIPAEAGIHIYTYDAFGRRIQKNVDGTITNFIYDVDQVICETNSAGTTTAKYIYGPGIDEPILMHRGAETYYYHFDGLGSVEGISDSTGTTVEIYSYDVFGNTTIKDASDTVISESAIGNPYAFTGRRLDTESGLFYYRARYYNPRIGRFLQTDPIGYYVGMNLYTYCGNNPVNWIDPWGLCKEGGRKGITSQDILDMLLGVGTAYAGELTSGQVKTYTIGELVSWKAWGGVVLTMAGRATMFVPLPGARIVGGVMMVAGGGLTIWGIVESINTAEDLATDIGEVINEPYKEEWEEIDRRILPTKK